jgi:ankyrin repeat protein
VLSIAPHRSTTQSLLRAARERETRRIKELLHAGADPNHKETGSGWTSLAYVSGFGLTSAVELLLDHGADPRLVSRNNWAPLHWAAYRGHADVVRLLLQFGGDPSARNSKNQTPPQLSNAAAVKQAFAAGSILPRMYTIFASRALV